MNAVLCGITILLMFVSMALFFRHNPASNSHESTSDKSEHCPLLTLLVIVGTAVAFGGYWMDWMLWVGLIIIELSCIIFHILDSNSKDG